MIDNDRAIAMIERAASATPFCPCGEPTLPVWHSDGMWLDCSAARAPVGFGAWAIGGGAVMPSRIGPCEHLVEASPVEGHRETS